MSEEIVSPESCQNHYRDLAGITCLDDHPALRLRLFWRDLKAWVLYVSGLGFAKFSRTLLPSWRLRRFMLKGKARLSVRDRRSESLDLRQGDWVEVRSFREILATLDEERKLRGLRFTPEMVKYCGKRLKVYKTLDRMVLEATGELRKIRSPTVLLEGAFCDGAAHGGCDRSCFCFWREAWLDKVMQ